MHLLRSEHVTWQRPFGQVKLQVLPSRQEHESPQSRGAGPPVSGVPLSLGGVAASTGGGLASPVVVGAGVVPLAPEEDVDVVPPGDAFGSPIFQS